MKATVRGLQTGIGLGAVTMTADRDTAAKEARINVAVPAYAGGNNTWSVRGSVYVNWNENCKRNAIWRSIPEAANKSTAWTGVYAASVLTASIESIEATSVEIIGAATPVPGGAQGHVVLYIHLGISLQ